MEADANAKVALWEHITSSNEPIQRIQPLNALPALVKDFSQENTIIVSNLKAQLRQHISTYTIL